MKLPSVIKGWLNTAETPEKWLANYVATGDKKYLSRLVVQFNQSLYHYLYSLSEKETAEDALQSTWLKVMKSSNSQNQQRHTNVKSWLYTIARNTLVDELRRQQKWQWQELNEQIVITKTLAENVEDDQKLAAFNIAINQLPFFQREAIIFQQEGFSVMEICQLTEDSFETVKSRLRYARKSLKELLRAHYER
ncbi:RNA polymerase sigma factor [Thalassotalea piscium]